MSRKINKSMDNKTEIQTPEGVSEKETIPFSREVEIRGKKYIFDGTIPKEPTHFKWYLRVPNWEEQKKKLEEQIAKGEISTSLFERIQLAMEGATFDPWTGAVASVIVAPDVSKDGKTDLLLNHIQTMARVLPEEYGYRGAPGLGSFLLDNLGALADHSGWRIYLNPSARESGLDGYNLAKWYERHGYVYPSADSSNGFQRNPQPPNQNLAISKILQEKQSEH